MEKNKLILPFVSKNANKNNNNKKKCSFHLPCSGIPFQIGVDHMTRFNANQRILLHKASVLLLLFMSDAM